MKASLIKALVGLLLVTHLEALLVRVAPRDGAQWLGSRSPTLEIAKFTAWNGGASAHVEMRIRVEDDEVHLDTTNPSGAVPLNLHFAICGDDTLEKISMSDADWWSSFNGGSPRFSRPGWDDLDGDISLSVCNHMEHIRTCHMFETLTALPVTVVSSLNTSTTEKYWEVLKTFDAPHLPGEMVYYTILLNCRQVPIHIHSLSGTFLNHALLDSSSNGADGDAFPDTTNAGGTGGSSTSSRTSSSSSFALSWLTPMPTHLSAGEITVPKTYFVFTIGWAIVTVFTVVNWLRYQQLPTGCLRVMHGITSCFSRLFCRSSCCKKSPKLGPSGSRRKRNRAYIIRLCSRLGKASRKFLRRSRRELERPSRPRYRIWVYTAFLLICVMQLLHMTVNLIVWLRMAWYGSVAPLDTHDIQSGRPGWMYPTIFDIMSAVLETFRMTVLISLSKGISIVRQSLTRQEKINMLLLSVTYGILYYVEQVAAQASATRPMGVVFLGQPPSEYRLVQRLLGPLSIFWSTVMFRYPLQLYSIVLFKYILANVNYIIPCLTTQLALVRRHDHTIDLEHTNVWRKLSLVRIYQTAVVCYIFGVALALVAAVFLMYEKQWAQIATYSALQLGLFGSLCYGLRLRNFNPSSSSFFSRLYSPNQSARSRRRQKSSRSHRHSIDDRSGAEDANGDGERDDSELIVHDDDQNIELKDMSSSSASKPPKRREPSGGGHSSGDEDGEGNNVNIHRNQYVDSDDDEDEGGVWGLRRRGGFSRDVPQVLVVLNPPTLSTDKSAVVPNLAFAAVEESTFFDPDVESSESDADE